MRALALVLAGLAAGCSAGAPGANVTVRDSAGVRIVEHAGQDQPLDWTFEVERRIGGEPEGPLSFYRVERQLVGVDGQGRILVLDRDAHRVVRVSPSGHVDLTVGREGGGPGEFQRPVRVTAAENGEFGVMDVARRRLIRFSAAGDLLDEVPAHSSGVALAPPGYVSRERRFTTETHFVELVHVRDGDTTVLAMGVAAPVSRYQLSGRCGQSPMFMDRPFFAIDLPWHMAGSFVAYASAASYTVTTISVHDGRLRQVRRTVPVLAGTRARALAVAEANPQRMRRQGVECVYPAEEVVDGRGFLDTIPRVQDLTVGPDGRLWVERYADDVPAARIDVFDPAGYYLGTLSPDTPLPMHFLPDGRALLVDTDENDVQRVAVARVIR